MEEDSIREYIQDIMHREPRDILTHLSGLDVNEMINKGKTILHVVVRLKEKKIASILLSAGANVNIADDNGDTPLSLAIDSESVEMVELLLNYNPDFSIKIVREKFYLCLLNSSSENKNIVQAMIRHGFFYEKTDNVCKTTLWYCIEYYFEEMAMSIVKFNRDFLVTIQIWHKSFLLHMQPFTDTQTEIFKIIDKIKNLFPEEIQLEWSGCRNKDLFNILLSEAYMDLMNINLINIGENWEYFEESDVVELTKGVLISCYDGDHPICDDKGRTGLHYAAKVGNIAVIKSLLDLHLDINVVDIDEKTPLDYAYDRISGLSGKNNDESRNNLKVYDSEIKCWFTLFELKIGAVMLLNHISKLITLNAHITLGNLKAVKSLLIMMSKDEIIMPYYLSVYKVIENCEFEVKAMKEKKLIGLSYYDFLTKDCNKISVYTKRKEAFEAFQSKDDILQEFEMYGPILQRRFQVINMRQGLLEYAEIKLFEILKWLQVPIVIVREILYNFSNEELYFFILHA